MLVSVMALALALTSPLAGWRTSAQSLLRHYRITFRPEGQPRLALSSDGAHLAFLSNRDLTGGNAMAFEIFSTTRRPAASQVSDSTKLAVN
jgi:hypothetical protein